MRKILYGLLLALFAGSALAADNAVVLTPGSGVTMRTKDVGALVQSPFVIPGDTAGAALATAPGTPNASFALPIQGVTSGTPVPISGTVTTSGTTTVSGTVTANQGGTWTVQPGNTANTTPWLVTGAVTQSGTWTIQPGNTANTTPWLVTVNNANPNSRATSANSSPVVQPAAPNSGATAFPVVNTSGASATATNIKTSAAVVFGCQLGNINATPVYVHIFNKASAPTPGTDSAVKTLIVPGNTAGAGSNVPFGPGGFVLSSGFGITITAGIATIDNTTVTTANTVVVNCDYE
jgi:hypothetical protein